MRQNWETMWHFETERFRVRLDIAWDYGFEYDGDDESGETQARLDSGEYVAFDSRVVVLLGSLAIGSDYLGSSVYSSDSVREFWEAHRDPDPMNRNCSVMREAKGGNVAIGHYFPDMVRNAIAEARKMLANMPHVRAA